MSVFNGQAYLAQAVDSILNQTFRDFEFIIIDDGSTDKTAEILAAYVTHDSRIRVITHENKGRATSLNIGIAAARSNYIARMDADDVAFPERLARQLEFLEAQPQVGILGGAVELIKRNGEAIQRMQPPTSDSEIRMATLHGNPMCHPTITARRQLVIAVGGYRKQFLDTDDYDLWLRMIELCEIANLDTCVLQYRIHANQASVRNNKHQAMCVLAARAAATFRKRGMPDPLSEAERIDLQLLNSLGVTPAQVRQAVTDSYAYWTRLLQNVDDEAALDCILQFAGNSLIDHGTRAEAFLSAASALYRKNRRGKALVSAARAVLLKPSLATLVAKRGLARLATPTGT